MLPPSTSGCRPFVCILSHVLAVLFGTVVAAARTNAGDVAEFCQDESFTARCDQPHQVPVVESARYGRMRLGRCVKRNLGYLGCAVDAMSVLDARCSGQPAGCELSVMDPILRELKPCPKDVTWHLEASYTCIEVLFGSIHECHARHHVTTSDVSGYLASSVALRTGVGSSSCPWHLRASPGQRVNLTLLSFIPPSPTTQQQSSSAGADTAGSAAEAAGGAASAQRQEICYDVGLIRDGEKRRSVTACGGQPRRRMMFVSETNAVELEFAVKSLTGVEQIGLLPAPQFIIQFQFVGCSNLVPPAGATVNRDADTLTVRCNLTGEIWYLTCTGTRWIGTIGNCSSHSTQTAWSPDEIFGQTGSFPLGILIVVAVGVALGVFLGGTMLLLASMFMKRRQRRHGLGRPDGSDDLKSMNRDGEGDQLDYTTTLQVGDQLRAKHYIMPDYSSGGCGSRKDNYVIGSTADVINAAGYDVTDYGSDRMMAPSQQQQQRGTLTVGMGMGMMPAPRIHYHVYESPQMT